MNTVKMVLVGGPRNNEVVEVPLHGDGLPDYWFQVQREGDVGYYHFSWHATGPCTQRAHYHWHHQNLTWDFVHEVMVKHYPEDQPKIESA